MERDIHKVLHHIAHIPRRIGITQRIIKRVTVPIETLAVVRRLDKQICTKESSQIRIINSPTHMNQVMVIQLVMSCITIGGDGVVSVEFRAG